ncbi:hypothetical protein CAEBREN_06611 [Caenorhabditis brenneri]|uniref:CX domain-containing protein n=1 Tax=Caenorhabditis brenneri TaxID=135651 RepID=G0MTT6_CAEBE|nr:hypothetical protein CAEBREN_06611 [Caenorhabditis brenneri]
MRLIFILLICSCVGLALNSTVKPMKRSKTNVTVVHDPSVSFRRYGMTYYWPGHFRQTRSNPKKCTLPQNHTDWPFGEHMLPNGTLLSGVEYGCQSDEICRKHRCERSIATGLVWCAFLLISSIISIGIVIRYIVSKRSEEVPPPVQEMEMRSVFIPVVIVDQESNGPTEDPPIHLNN